VPPDPEPPDRPFIADYGPEAEHELEAATTRTALNAAAKKLMRAKQELKRLGAELAERPSRGWESAGAS
jgi:hypothetical protein